MANISDCVVVSNTASTASEGYGGGLYLTGFSAATLSGNTTVNNRASDGGGIFNNGSVLTLTNSTIISKTADFSGGGIKNDNGGMVELTNCAIIANRAIITDGGGIDNFRNGTVNLANSTISGNTAKRDGGGIDNWGDSTLELTNCTVSGNTANYGGGIANQGTVQLSNCTISSNTAYTNGGGIKNFFASSTVELTNTIVASQTVGEDCHGNPVISFGYNLDSDGSCTLTATGDITNINPLLGLLKNNGGDTETHALLLGSPAIDHIPNGVNGCGIAPLDKDQRGVARPQGGACDIGAYEASRIYLPIILKNR